VPNRAPGAHRGLRKYRGRPAGAMARWGAAFRALYGRLVSAAAHSLACLGFVCSRRVGWSLVPRGAAHSGLPSRIRQARCAVRPSCGRRRSPSRAFKASSRARTQERPFPGQHRTTRGPDGSLIRGPFSYSLSIIPWLAVQSSCCTRERK